MKKILVTSGGTRVPIDKVRYIMNRSHGTFGSKIAWELLKRSMQDPTVAAFPEVHFLSAEWARTPFTVTGNLVKESLDSIQGRAALLANFYGKVRYRYTEVYYSDFDSYAAMLKTFVQQHQYDAIVLAAAVSDYLCANYVDGKIRSDEDLSIALEHAPKLIGKVKEWAPRTHLVGFKLLVNSKPLDLVDAAYRSVETNHCDFVVANVVLYKYLS